MNEPTTSARRLRVLHQEEFQPGLSRNPIVAVLDQEAELETYDDQDPGDFDLALIDVGSEPERLTRPGNLFEPAFDSGVPCLLLDVDDACKRQIRGRLGFAMLSEEDTTVPGLFAAKEGRDHVTYAELPANGPSTLVQDVTSSAGAGGAAVDGRLFQSGESRVPRLITAYNDLMPSVRSFVTSVMRYTAEKKTHPPGSIFSRDGEIDAPDDLKKWTFKVTRGQVYQTSEGQTARLDVTFDVSLFLHNPPDGDHYQFIHVKMRGTANPGELAAYASHDVGWVQTGVHLRASPYPADWVVREQTSPATANNQTTVKSAIGFNVGFTKSDGGLGSFSYSREREEVIRDWKVYEETAGKEAAWRFVQATPYDGRDRHYRDARDFWYVLRDFPDLSRFTKQFTAQAVWRTEKVRGGSMTIGAQATQDLHWHRSVPFVGLFTWMAEPFVTARLDIDLDKVVLPSP